MITKKGTILSSISSIANSDADKNYVLIRRKRNRAITVMYLIVFLFFLVLMSFTSQILLVILT